MAAALLFADRAGQPVQFGGDAGIILITLFAEGADDLPIRCAFNRAGEEDGRLAARGLDLLLEPLEVFMRSLVEGQHVDRVLDRHRPELLQLAPGAHAQVRRLGRQLVNQQNPILFRRAVSHIFSNSSASVTTVTNKGKKGFDAWSKSEERLLLFERPVVGPFVVEVERPAFE